MRMPLVSVVVPTLSSSVPLERCVASLRSQSFRNFETIVVQDRGAEPPAERLGNGDGLPSFAVLPLAERSGFAGAANAGAEVARGTYLAIINDDVELDPAWLAVSVGCLERHPRAASVASKIMQHGGDRVIDGAGDSMTLSLKAYRRGQGDRDEGQFDHEEQVFSASGTACLWRLDVFRRLGGFDRDFFAYYEDVDLGFRARLLGHECWYTPAAVAFHVGSATAGAEWRKFESLHSVRNRWTTVVKNAPLEWIVKNAHRILAGELVSLTRAVYRRELRLVLSAYFAIGRTFRSSLGKRAANGPTRGAYRTLREVVKETFPPMRSSLWRLRQAKELAATVDPGGRSS